MELSEHQAKMAEQQAAYEDRIAKLDAEHRRAERGSAGTLEETEGRLAAQDRRITDLEGALADKQRLLDDVGSQLIDLQGAFAKLSSGERAKASAKSTDQKRREAALARMTAGFTELLGPEVGAGKVELVREPGAMVVVFGDGALFAQGSSQLSREALALAKRVATGLIAEKESPIRIDVHSDNVVPKKGTFRDSWSLTSQQGTSLVRALQEGGVDPSRLSHRACGQFAPHATNDTREGRAKNRRVELRLLVTDL